MNGYPLHLVQGVINKSWEKETIKTILKENPLPENDQKKKGYYDILHAPYIQGFTYAGSILEWCTKKGTQ